MGGNRRLGFTTVELLVAIVLTAMVIAAAAGVGMAFMRTARDVEVSSSLQRELVFSAEAIVNELKVATRWEPLSPSWPDDDREYRVYKIDPGTMQESATPTIVRLAGSELRVGNRVVSKNINLLDIVPQNAEGSLASVELETLPPVIGFGANSQPLALFVDVMVRNNEALFSGSGDGQVNPPDEEPHPEVTVENITHVFAGPNWTISFTTAPVKTTGWVVWRETGSSGEWSRSALGNTTDHSLKINVGKKNADFDYYLDLTDEWGRAVPPFSQTIHVP